MMKKRMLTGTLAMMMVVSALSTGMVFADETTTGDAEQGRGGAAKFEMMQNGGRGQGGQEAKEEKRAEQQEKMQGVIDEYYPEISDEWNEVHEDMKTTTDAIRDLVKPEDGERPERPEGNENGERPEKPEGGRKQLPEGFDDMTDEEKLAAREEMKANAPDGERPERGNKGGPRGGMNRMFGEDVDFENMTDEEIEALKAEREALREEREEQREAFKTAVEEGDEDTIQDILDDMLENAEERLVKAEEKLAELQATE